MKTGIAVNVGLNSVTSNVYTAAPLEGAEADAKAMFEIAKARGFDMNLSEPPLLGAAATFEAVKNRVLKAAEILQPGDLFFFSFAGHGTFKVLNGTSDEDDNHDESIVLADHFMIDNFWRKKLWPKFKPGVRILAIADCCHSGTNFMAMSNFSTLSAEAESVGAVGNVVSRAAGEWSRTAAVPARVPQETPLAPQFRVVSDFERQKEWNAFPAFYSAQLETSPEQITARRLFLAACKDDQKAADGPHGAFTASLLSVWADGNFAGTYEQMMQKISFDFEGPDQTPMFTQIGEPNLSLEQAFKI